MKNLSFYTIAMLIGASTMFSCNDAKEQVVLDGTNPANVTRAYGDKSPKVVAYIEINDINPLNAGDYYNGEVAENKALIDVVEFFASNIRKRTVGGVVEPTLYLNDKLTRVLEPDPANPTTTGYHKYVAGLQAKGIKVLLTVLGDHQGIGVANMNATQTTQFANILAHVVAKYNLDGIGFDDEYSDYPSGVNQTSFSQIITKLRAAMPAGKLITVFDWGNTNTISTAARGLIDYSYPGVFGPGTFYTTPALGLAKANWSPMALNLGNGYDSYLETIANNASKSATGGYGAIMTFNMRRSSTVDPLSVFDAIAYGAYGTSATCSNGNRAQDWTFIPAGYTITVDDVK